MTCTDLCFAPAAERTQCATFRDGEDALGHLTPNDRLDLGLGIRQDRVTHAGHALRKTALNKETRWRYFSRTSFDPANVHFDS